MLFETEPAGSATISPCGRYRYTLERSWHEDNLRLVNFVMLNPSTADASEDDPTIRRCIRFAQSWGFGRLVVTNLYALRATDPRELWKADDPVGPNNDRHIVEQAKRAHLVVCAWGNHGSPGWAKDPATSHRGRGPVVMAMLRDLGIAPHALMVTSKCQPSHPLRLPADLKPEPIVDLMRSWEFQETYQAPGPVRGTAPGSDLSVIDNETS